MGFVCRLFGSRADSGFLDTPQKKPFLLFELLIGLSLTALLLSILFTSIVRVAKFDAKLSSARTTLLARQHLQIRLQDLFMGLQPNAPMYTQKLPHEKCDSLIATFTHGMDPESAFSGDVLCRIYLDEHANLCLAMWPANESALWRNEVLFPHATQCQFQFLGPIRQEDAPHAITPTLAWHQHWSKERSANPMLIRLEIGEKKAPLQFAFFLPSKGAIAYGDIF